MLVYTECELFPKIYRSVLVKNVFKWIMLTNVHNTIQQSYLLDSFGMVETGGFFYLPIVRKLHFLENESYMACCFIYFSPRHIDHVILAVVNTTEQRKQFSQQFQIPCSGGKHCSSLKEHVTVRHTRSNTQFDIMFHYIHVGFPNLHCYLQIKWLKVGIFISIIV